ncbi:hypothetical protein C8R45DRAFT_1100067 [Mycena sanguinolenta]|nr:hypothetical protein C8R45DRAFT_1100067 [Mycena sanguinolenta]
MSQSIDQKLLNTPLGRLFGNQILALQDLYPGVQLDAVAESLHDPHHYVYAALNRGGSFENGRFKELMWMPTEGPEYDKIKHRPIPTTTFAIRQYPLAIGSHPEEVDRQAFLLDFYDTARQTQLATVPHGYTFSARSLGPRRGEPQVVMGWLLTGSWCALAPANLAPDAVVASTPSCTTLEYPTSRCTESPQVASVHAAPPPSPSHLIPSQRYTPTPHDRVRLGRRGRDRERARLVDVILDPAVSDVRGKTARA